MTELAQSAAVTSPSDRRERLHADVLSNLDVRPYIDGDFRATTGGDTMSIVDPGTGEKLVEMPVASEEDVSRAVAAARTAFDSGEWPRLHARARAGLLYKLADAIEAHLDQLALLEAADAGKRFAGVRGWDIPNAAEVYRYFAGWADKYTGIQLPSPAGVEMYTRLEPVGVCAAITPWNFPFPCTAWKIAPALAAGCTVVVKSPERAPPRAQFLAKLAHEIGFPPGVINVVMGRGPEAGQALISDPRIDKVTFTGETATAQAIIRGSLHHMPRLTLELGDKTPVVILADADLDAAIPTAAAAAFGVSGQNCCAGSRLIVESSIADQVAAGVAEIAKSRRLGDQFDDTTEQGPQIDERHVVRIHGFVERAQADGAEVLAGGSPTLEGRFFQPTVVAGLRAGAEIARSEVFGPVTSLLTVSGLDEAIRVANDRSFGLAASVWSTSQASVDRMVREVRAGTCWVNTFEYFDTMLPWGGRGLSGQGKELGHAGLYEFLEEKAVVRVA